MGLEVHQAEEQTRNWECFLMGCDESDGLQRTSYTMLVIILAYSLLKFSSLNSDYGYLLVIQMLFLFCLFSAHLIYLKKTFCSTIYSRTYSFVTRSHIVIFVFQLWSPANKLVKLREFYEMSYQRTTISSWNIFFNSCSRSVVCVFPYF